MYAVIKRYKTETTAIMNDEVVTFNTYKSSDYNAIYEKMMEITDGDHEISADAASWCELACDEETYEFREGEIEMRDIEAY